MFIHSINKTEVSHLEDVKRHASAFGNVELTAYYDGEVYHLLEGSHRIQAAKELSLPVTIRVLDWEDEVITDVDGIDANTTVGELVDYVYSSRWQGNSYTSDDFASVNIV